MTKNARAGQTVLPALRYLTAAAVLLVFANGRWVWSPAAWLAPMFMLLFLHSRPRVGGLLIGFAVQLLAFFIHWRGMIPVPGAWYYLVAGIYALFYYLPYVVHRRVAPEFRGFAATLVLPSAWVAIELLFQRLVTPYGSWASVAYTQVDHVLLLQLAAITGTSGISFVIIWNASVWAWLWRHRERFDVARRGLAVYAVVMGLVLGWGGYRLLTARQSPQFTVQVSGLTPSPRLQNEVNSELRRGPSEGSANEAAATARVLESAGRLNDDLIARTVRAAEEGADLVVWSEHAARVMPQTEDALVNDASLVAHRLGVNIVLGIGSWNPGATPSFENKLTAIKADGSTAWTYHKARPIAGNESGLIDAGNTVHSTLDTAFGRVGAVICHDLDFPEFVRSVGRNDVDLLIAPSSDWDDIMTMHHRMAVVRAVENGCALFRPCESGISSAVDYGRMLDTRRETDDAGLSFSVTVPLYDVATLYPKLGDWVGYAGGLLIAVLVVFSRRRVRTGEA